VTFGEAEIALQGTTAEHDAGAMDVLILGGAIARGLRPAPVWSGKTVARCAAP
jgi:hypothetical protein